MAQINFRGYSPDIRVIEVVKLVRKYTGLGLYDAKTLVERGLQGEAISLNLAPDQMAREMAEEVSRQGLIVEVLEQ
jgi:ribosomal protein L7/L12